MSTYWLPDEEVGRLEPVQLELYLQKRQWLRAGHLRDVASIWHKGAVEGPEVLVPLNRSLKDFRHRVLDLISALADEEGRSPTLVARDVAKVSANAVSIRVIH